MKDNITTLTYEENNARDMEHFAAMLRSLNLNHISYTVRRAHGLVEINIQVGAC